MKTLIVIVAVSILGWFMTNGQKQDAPASRRVLVEARYLGVGMSAFDGNRLIARIYDDGLVEYEDVKDQHSLADYEMRTAKLTEEELKRLSRLLIQPEVGSLANSYAAFSSTIDHREDLTLSVYFQGANKQIEVENFKPELPKAKAFYPPKLLSVTCWTEFARKDARIKFFFRETSVCCTQEQLCGL